MSEVSSFWFKALVFIGALVGLICFLAHIGLGILIPVVLILAVVYVLVAGLYSFKDHDQMVDDVKNSKLKY